MIEIVYEKEKQKPVGNEGFFRIPNNIRQIGEINEAQKIYIEDYAYTYLSRLSNDNIEKGLAAVLLGKTNWSDKVSYLFVKSAIVIQDMDVSEDYLKFTDDIWNQIYETNKEYFNEQEIVGWYLSIPGCSMNLHEMICRTHLDHFGGKDKVLLVMEPTEKEEAFYRYEKGRLSRQTGFYIYYEKNEPMQNYIIAQKANQPKKEEIVEDKAVKNFRKIIETKAETKRQKNTTSFVYAASTCLVVAVLAMGVVFVNDYQKLRNAEQMVAEITSQAEGSTADSQTVDAPVNGFVSDSAENTDTDSAADSSTEETDETAAQETSSEDPKEEEEQVPEEETQQPEEEDDEKSVESADTAATAQSYTIQKGDTLSSISKRFYGTLGKVNEISALNGISPEQIIYPGQKILLP